MAATAIGMAKKYQKKISKQRKTAWRR